MKKLSIIVLIAFNIFIKSGDLFDEDCNPINKALVMQKIQDEYKALLSSNDLSTYKYISINDKYNPTLFEIIKNLFHKMKVNKPISNLLIFKGNQKTKNLADKFGIDTRINAFTAYDLKTISIYIGEALINILTYEELEAVIAHELGHVKLMHPQSIVKKIKNFALFGLGTNIILSAVLYNLSLSFSKILKSLALYNLVYGNISLYYILKSCRKFEFEADEEILNIIKNKDNLISALKKINDAQIEVFKKSSLYEFQFNFSTHPSIKNRDLNLVKK